MPALTLAFNAVAPIILLLVLGKALKNGKLIDERFISATNKLAYNLLLPTLLFSSVSTAQMRDLFDANVLIVGVLGTVIVLVLFVGMTHYVKLAKEQQGVVVQGSFRANMGIVGLALCSTLLGESGLALASVFLGIMVPIFNVLSISVLVKYSGKSQHPKNILLQVIKSPIILAIVFAIPFSVWSIQLPKVITHTTALLGQATLPLALICIGASLTLRDFTNRLKPLALIIVGKTLIYPAVMTCFAWYLGVRGDALTVIVIMAMAPTATASFPAVQYFGGDKALAADAIAVTTILSLPLYIAVIVVLALN